MDLQDYAPEPDTFCIYGNPVFWGWCGPSTHECADCASHLNPAQIMLIMRKCHEQHNYNYNGWNTPKHCDQCVWDEEYDGYKHPLSPESVKIQVVVILPEADKWGHDAHIDLSYTEGTEWSFGAAYGYNTQTDAISCYAD